MACLEMLMYICLCRELMRACFIPPNEASMFSARSALYRESAYDSAGRRSLKCNRIYRKGDC